MKIIVIGGSGLIGSKLVARLRQQGHEAVAASPRSGVNAVTGEGSGTRRWLARMLWLTWPTHRPGSPPPCSNSSSVRAKTSPRPRPQRPSSIMWRCRSWGTDRSPDIAYFRAKLAQETIVKASSVPYSIVRATQFFEFLGAIAETNASARAGSSLHQRCSSRSHPTT